MKVNLNLVLSRTGFDVENAHVSLTARCDFGIAGGVTALKSARISFGEEINADEDP